MPRPLLLQNYSDNNEHMHCVAPKEHGANQKTMDVLANIATDTFHFVQLCGDWGAGKTGVRRQKKEYDKMIYDAKNDKKVAMPARLTRVRDMAWSNRPLGVDDLRKAVLLYADFLRKKSKITKIVGDDKMTPMEEVGLCNDIIEWLTKSANRKKGIQYFFTGAGGFRKEQQASNVVRAMQRRLGGALSKEELGKKWPCILQPFGNREAKKDAEDKKNGKLVVRLPNPNFKRKGALSPSLALEAEESGESGETEKHEAEAEEAEEAAREGEGEESVIGSDESDEEDEDYDKDEDASQSDFDDGPFQPLDRRFASQPPKKKPRYTEPKQSAEWNAVFGSGGESEEEEDTEKSAPYTDGPRKEGV